MEEVGYWSTYKMPIPMESPRWSFAIEMEEVGCWSTCKMPVTMESPRWSLDIIMDLVEENWRYRTLSKLETLFHVTNVTTVLNVTVTTDRVSRYS